MPKKTIPTVMLYTAIQRPHFSSDSTCLRACLIHFSLAAAETVARAFTRSEFITSSPSLATIHEAGKYTSRMRRTQIKSIPHTPCAAIGTRRVPDTLQAVNG